MDDMLGEDNDKTRSVRPHVAVLNVVVDGFDAEELEEYDIQPAFLLSVVGQNKADCLQKLKRKMAQFTT